MRTSMAPPWPVSGYGALEPAEVRIGAFVETESILFTPGTYTDPEAAVEAAAELAGEHYMPMGYTISGVGFEVLTLDPVTEMATYRGWISFVGSGPPGSVPFGTKRPPWWHYGLAAGGGVVGGIIIGALIGYAAR